MSYVSTRCGGDYLQELYSLMGLLCLLLKKNHTHCVGIILKHHIFSSKFSKRTLNKLEDFRERAPIENLKTQAYVQEPALKVKKNA